MGNALHEFSVGHLLVKRSRHRNGLSVSSLVLSSTGSKFFNCKECSQRNVHSKLLNIQELALVYILV